MHIPLGLTKGKPVTTSSWNNSSRKEAVAAAAAVSILLPVYFEKAEAKAAETAVSGAQLDG